MPEDEATRKPKKRHWFERGLSFKCTQCGNCCTGPSGVVYVSDEEVNQIAEFQNMKPEAFRAEYCEKWHGRWTLKEVAHPQRGYDCVFLRFDSRTNKAMCRIYPVRPTQCRTWPFWSSNLKSKKQWDQAAKNCPGMRQSGDFYPVEEIGIRVSMNPKGI